MFKNFLWFSKNPADEREAAILSAAYQRALAVLWVGNILAWLYVSLISQNSSFETPVILNAIVGLFVVSVLAGWVVVRREEMTFAKPKTGKRLAFLWVPTIAAVSFVGALALTWYSPRLEYVGIVGFIAIEQVAFAIWAWNWTRGFTWHGRMVGALLFPMSVVGYQLDRKASNGSRLLMAFVMHLAFTLVPAAIAFPFFETVAMPAGFFGPVAPGYEYNATFTHTVLDKRMVGGLHAGDLVMLPDAIILPSGARPTYGVVQSVSGNDALLEVLDDVTTSSTSEAPDRSVTEAHKESFSINIDGLVAKVIVDPPFASVLTHSLSTFTLY